jgi:hypothetical protein
MAHPSKNIYWLSAQETNSLYRSPEHEELLASNCGFRNTVITSESSNADIRAFMQEQSPGIQEKLRESLINSPSPARPMHAQEHHG